MSRFVAHLKSNLVGYIALFVALGGTSYAAVSIPNHSIGASKLERGAVGTRALSQHAVGQAQLKYSSVGSRQLRRGSVRGAQISPGAVGAAQLAPGSVGAAQLGAGAVGTSQLNATELPVYIAAFAEVFPNGSFGASSPQATLSGWGATGGIVNFPVSLAGCSALVTASGPPTSTVTAGVVVDSVHVGINATTTPAVTVAVLCPAP